MKIHADIDLNKKIKDVPVADRQSKTVNRLLELLADQPGVILGDEVGMGKTFVALATALTYIAHSDRNKRILILTPSKELKDKWDRDIDTFRNYCIKDNSQLKRLARDKGIESIRELLKDKTPILTIPLNRVAGMPKEEEMLCYLGAYFRKKGFGADKRKEMMRSIRGTYNLRTIGNITDSLVMSPEHWGFNDYWIYDDVKDLDFTLFDDTIKAGKSGSEFKEDCRCLRNQLIPEFSFCIIDEAHNYKNPWTVGHKLFNDDKKPEATLMNKFGKMLFLTATPFQLGYDELINIFRMFNAAKTCPVNYNKRIDELKKLLKKYKNAMDIFEKAWGKLSLYPERDITNEYECAKRAKSGLEVELRKFIVRNVKDKGHRKVVFGACNNGNINSAGIDIPDKDKPLFYSLLRLENEIGRDNRTFSGLTDSMATSAYSTLRESKMIKELSSQGDDIISKYQKLICDLIPAKNDKHPKISDVVDSVVDRYKRGEKSLIFTFYIKTAESLKRVIAKRLTEYRSKIFKKNNITPQKYKRNLEKSLQDKNDIRYLVMHENILLTYNIPRNLTEIDYENIVRLLGKYKFNFNNPDYRKLLRTCEHYLVKKNDLMNCKQMKNIIIEEKYISFGLRESQNEGIEIDSGYILKKDHIEWVKNSRALQYIMKGPNIWMYHKDLLKEIYDIDFRRTIQEYILREIRREDFIIQEFIETYLTEKTQKEKWGDVINRVYSENKLFNRSFRPEVLEERVNRWITDILKEYNLYKKNNAENVLTNRIQELSIIRPDDDVVYIHGGNVNRSIYFQAYNSPFRPVILICTSIGSEGIDLQHECSAVYLYDLGWNPAALEQKVGRIDRIGSKNQREREEAINKDHLPKIEIYRPYIKGTRDERMHRVLQNREKWFNFLLGTGERLSDDENGDDAKFEIVNKEENMMPLPEWRVKELTLNLGTDYGVTNA